MKNHRLPLRCLLLLSLLMTDSTVQTAAKTDTIHPVATHAMAIVFGYVTNAQRNGQGDIEPFVFNPFTGRLENSGVLTRLADLFNQKKAYILTNVSLFRTMLKWYPNVKLDEWRCKLVNNFVYLFVQNALLPPENEENSYAQLPDLQKLEPLLGIKISDKATQSTAELRSPYYVPAEAVLSKDLNEECARIIEAIWNGKQSKIFLTQTDYATNQLYLAMQDKPIIPIWAFLMFGFGAQSESMTNLNGLVCGLTVPVFKQVLNFFTTQLNMGMMVVSSSYFPDINLVATLKEDNRPQLKKLPFTFVSSSITAAPILSGLGLEETHAYNDFFSKLLPPKVEESFRINWQPNPKNFQDVIALACRPYRYFVGSTEFLTTPANIPIMRMANQPFFVPARFGDRIVVIGDTLIKPGFEKLPLYLRELMQPDTKNDQVVPDAILISCTKDFTRPLVLATRADKKLPMIIGLHPGAHVYTFDEIDAQAAPISAVIDAFLRIPNLAQERAFIIKKLHATNDISTLVPVNKPRPERSFYELKIIHKRTTDQEKRNMILIKQFDCVQNCMEKNIPIPPVVPTPAKPLPVQATAKVEPVQKAVPAAPSVPKVSAPSPTAPIAPTAPMAPAAPMAPKTTAQPSPVLPQPTYNPVAVAVGTSGDKLDIKWQAISLVTDYSIVARNFDETIATMKKTQLPPTLELFAS